MEKHPPKAKPVSAAREYFVGELKEVMSKHQISAKPDSFEYLVNLLVRFMETENFYERDEAGRYKNHFLLELYGSYLNGNAETKAISLRRLGDVCLMVTGFFPDSLNRKLVDVDYYLGMGGNAYAQLSQLQFTDLTRSLFGELAQKFRPFSDVLSELSDRSGLNSNADLLRLYEKWLMTGSERLKSLLSEKGIQPLLVDVKTKH